MRSCKKGVTDPSRRGHPGRVDTRIVTSGLILAITSGGVAFAFAACGGQTATNGTPDASSPAASRDAGGIDGTSGGGDTGAPADTGLDAVPACGFACDGGADTTAPSSCPATPPAPGSMCTGTAVCEYGTNWWLDCNVVLRCALSGQPDGSSVWTLEHDGGECSWLDAGGPCPSTWAEANAVDAQSGSCPFVSCVYPEGFCGCGIGCGGGGGAPRKFDVNGIFVCIPEMPGCPEPRPVSGSPCDDDASAYCGYDFACGCGQVQSCVDGIWQAFPSPPCP
jgi:hypothetical protein